MTTETKTMPAVFVGHGNPLQIVRHNRWTEGWAALGNSMPRPRAILVVSAHWYLPATRVTAAGSPPTIHDFGGFPQELYEVVYPSPGDPGLASRVQALLAPLGVESDEERGLDHGAWSVLHHMFPLADIPVVQLSIDGRQPPLFHYQTGKMLSPLRDEGILLMGSGNLVHNQSAYEWDRPDVEPYGWASTFEKKVRDLLRAGNTQRSSTTGNWGLRRDFPCRRRSITCPSSMSSVPCGKMTK